MEESILKSIKKLLGLAADYNAFDTDIIIHINSAFSVLHQLGASPLAPIVIEDDAAVWGSYFGNVEAAQMVKTYIYQKVRLAFDPPATSFAIAALQESVKEAEWRLRILEFQFDPDGLAYYEA